MTWFSHATEPIEQKWETVKHPDYLRRDHWRLVRSDSRVLADVDRYDDGAWRAWVNGSLFGEYIDVEAAKRRAEQIAVARIKD